MKSEILTIKNKKTGQKDLIVQDNIDMKNWGFSFFVDSELNAYKASYQYRNNPYGVVVEFAGGAKKWMVTVFNARAIEIDLDGTKQ